jgi:hypothetical protein
MLYCGGESERGRRLVSASHAFLGRYLHRTRSWLQQMLDAVFGPGDRSGYVGWGRTSLQERSLDVYSPGQDDGGGLRRGL